jgi:hypothetical protein
MLKPLLQKDEWEGLPDDVKPHYTEEDGVMRLGVTPDDGLELMNPSQLKKTLQTVRSEASKAEKARKALEAKLGDLDVDEARTAIAKLEEMAGMDVEGKARAEREAFEKQMTAKFKTDRENLLKKHSGEADAAAKSIAVLEAQLQKQMIAAAASKAISEAGGSVELLLPIVERNTRMVKQEDGTFRVVVVDAEGMERLSPIANSSAPMTIVEHVTELSGDKRYARGFDGSGASGSGAGRSGTGGSGAASFKLSAADAKNPVKYRAAKAAAEKAGRGLEIM